MENKNIEPNKDQTNTENVEQLSVNEIDSTSVSVEETNETVEGMLHEESNTIPHNDKPQQKVTKKDQDIDINELETNELGEGFGKDLVKIDKALVHEESKEPLAGVLMFAEKFSSTGAAFLLATLGIITQTFHNGFLFFELSSFDNFWLNLFQTMIGAFGLSGALLYFTIRAANGGGKVVNQLVYGFFIFEIFANLYYWSNKLVIQPWGTEDMAWSSMIIAVPFAIMIPFTIKAYAGELNFKKKDTQTDLPIGDMIDKINHQSNKINELSNDVDSVNSKVDELDSQSLKVGEDFNIDVQTIDGTKSLKSKIRRA